ncbi:MAG TPA: peptidoglycan DD-metalloendopeptidase family protein [Actinomycetota bacterium]|nr:peptidoglycan DD-metalloendopeptidase family protein [Actinomycetota bacterium]
MLLTVVLSTLFAPASHAAESESKKLQQTRTQLKAARSQLSSLKRNEAQLRATMRGVQRNLNSAKNLLSQAQRKLAEIDARIRSHERQIEKLSSLRAERDEAVDKRIASLYMMGPGLQADALMTAGDFKSFADRSNALDFVISRDKRHMEDLAKLRDRERKAQVALRKEAEQAQTWRRRVSERVSLVWDALSTQKQAKAALDAQIAEQMKEVRALEAEQNRIQSMIARRGSISRGAVSMKGFQWPAKGRRITSSYGRRGGGYHTGMDIDCETGEGTYAAKEGRVIASERAGGYGNMIIIDHGNGVSSLYAHHSRLYVREGAQVERGQKIGACGSTGNSTGSHLHFEIRVNGQHRNPRPYLP